VWTGCIYKTQKFQSTLPVGGATVGLFDKDTEKLISIHAPRGGSDFIISVCIFPIFDFNPRSPWGERLICNLPGRCDGDFNPRSPWGERPISLFLTEVATIFQSTLPVGGATLRRRWTSDGCQISIHAPRGGSDLFLRPLVVWQPISIHAPRGGSDFAGVAASAFHGDFNPRSPWGERRPPRLPADGLDHFNPRSPWGERRSRAAGCQGAAAISIHAPRGGSDRIDPIDALIDA